MIRNNLEFPKGIISLGKQNILYLSTFAAPLTWQPAASMLMTFNP